MNIFDDLEKQINDIKNKYQNDKFSTSIEELQNAAKEIDNLRAQVQSEYQKFDSSMHRNESGQFQRVNYDINQVAQVANKVNQLDDLCYDVGNDLYLTANKKQIMYNGKEFRRNQIRLLARFYQLRINNTLKTIEELNSKPNSLRNKTEIEIQNIAIEKYRNNYEELNELVEKLNSELDIIKNGGSIDYDDFLNSNEKAVEFMENEALLGNQDNLDIDNIENEQSDDKINNNKRKAILDEYIDKEKEFDVFNQMNKRVAQEKIDEQELNNDELLDNIDEVIEEEEIQPENINIDDEEIQPENINIDDEEIDLNENDSNDSSGENNEEEIVDENDIIDIELPPNPNLNVEEEKKEEEKEEQNKEYQTQNPQVVPIKPKRKKNSPKITWKTVASVAAGVGMGAGVFFAAGPVGVGIMMLAGSLAKKIIANQEKKLATITRLNGATKVNNIVNPSEKMRGPIGKLKAYLKSPEGLRDMKWMINAALITGAGLSIGQAAQQFFGNTASIESATYLEQVPAPETIPSTPDVVTQAPEILTEVPDVTNQLGYDGIRLGESIGEYNVTTGYDTSNWAISGQNAEALNTNLINSTNSQFGRFRIINPDGSNMMIDSAGVSIQDLINSGYDVNNIAIDVMSNGQSQAWVNVSDIIGGGKGL